MVGNGGRIMPRGQRGQTWTNVDNVDKRGRGAFCHSSLYVGTPRLDPFCYIPKFKT